jgi:hypothetical protein
LYEEKLMSESQVKFLLIVPKSLIEDVGQASLRLGQSKAAFVRECIKHRLKVMSGKGADRQPTVMEEDSVEGRFEALLRVVVMGLITLVGLVVMSYPNKG